MEQRVPPVGKRKSESKQEHAKRNLQAIMDNRYEDVDADILANPRQLKNFEYGAAALKRARRPKPQTLDGVLDNTWVWGPAGSGKDLFVLSKIGGDRPIFRKGGEDWVGYDGEEDVLISDYSGSKPRDLKQWADRYPFPAEQGFIWQSNVIRPKRIWVTSCCHPNEYFKGHDGVSIRNRFQIIHMEDGVADYEKREADVMPPPPLIWREAPSPSPTPPSPK